MSQRNPLLEISPFEIDDGQLVGRVPAEVSPEILAEKFSAQNPLKAIRARCLDCCAGDASEVRKCVATNCPAWPFRMGANPFRRRMRLTDDERRRRAEQLKANIAPSKQKAPAGAGTSGTGAKSKPDQSELERNST